MAKLAHLPLPPLELLEEIFVISPDSPSGLRWKSPKARNVKVNDVAGSKKLNGYWQVGITTNKQWQYWAHRIVYFLQTKQDPGILQVDHVNGISDPLMLRLALNGENQANRKKQQSINGGKCSSIYKGVTWHKKTCKWLAQIYFQNKRFHLGYFTSEIEAAKAYNNAALKHFGEFASVNKF
jgi:hypothetical protein